MKRPLFRLASFLPVVALLPACQTYQQQGNKAMQHWKNGETTLAVEEFGKLADKNVKSKDHIIWNLEYATALRSNNSPQHSLEVFQIAENKIDEYENKAKVSASREAGAAVSNQANLPYRGRSYDKIMLNTYKALNYWQINEPDKTRVEIFRAYQRQQDAVEENKRSIEKAQEEEQTIKEKESVAKAREDSAFQNQINTIKSNLENLKPYADYVNPFTVFLNGLYFLYHSEGATDLERSRKSFEQLLVLSPENTYIKQELDRVSDKANNLAFHPITYVIFETGSAPIREQIRIDIPIIISKVSYVGAAFPRLTFQEDYHYNLLVNAGNEVVPTQTIASMDSIVGQAFKKELPIIITKTLISTIVKATAAYLANEAADEAGTFVALFTRIGTAVAQAAVNIADLRTWTTLPKEFQYCPVLTPADGRLILTTPDGTQSAELIVNPDSFHFIHVRSINRTSDLIVNYHNLL